MSAARRFCHMSLLAHSSVGDLRICPRAPGSDKEAQGMATEEENAKDKGPFFRLDPFVVFEIVGVGQQGVES